MSKKINSHVQVPKLIIKQFIISPENGKAYALNLKNKKIYQKAPSTIGISNGYFDESAECLLNKEYETPFGKLINKIKDTYNANNNVVIELSNEDQNLISDFLIIFLTRDPLVLEGVREKSCFRKDITASELITKSKKTNLNKIYFMNHYPVLVINETKKSFISSIKGYTVFKKEGGNANWWFPLNPKFGICYASKDLFEGIFKSAKNITISECELIQFYNDYIYKQAIENKNDYVFSNDKNEIERIKYLL